MAGRLERSLRDEIKKTVPPCEFCIDISSGWAWWEWGPYLSSFLSWLYLSLLTLPQVCLGAWSLWQAN